jgi:hypothetical protein
MVPVAPSAIMISFFMVFRKFIKALWIMNGSFYGFFTRHRLQYRPDINMREKKVHASSYRLAVIDHRCHGVSGNLPPHGHGKLHIPGAQ